MSFGDLLSLVVPIMIILCLACCTVFYTFHLVVTRYREAKKEQELKKLDYTAYDEWALKQLHDGK